MSKRRGDNLPDPSHPFAKWGAGVAISCWALGVQNFSDPWNKLGALISPGIGYIIGLLLDWLVSLASETGKQRRFSKAQKRMDDLFKQRQDYIGVGANPTMISIIDMEIERCRLSIVELTGSMRPTRSQLGNDARKIPVKE
jgi:hypothetical protein